MIASLTTIYGDINWSDNSIHIFVFNFFGLERAEKRLPVYFLADIKYFSPRVILARLAREDLGNGASRLRNREEKRLFCRLQCDAEVMDSNPVQA